MESRNKLRLSLYAVFTSLGLLILLDFALPGSAIVDEISDVKSERQQYFNAGGNSHLSYKIVTNKHEFSVSEDFARTLEGNETIEYSMSRIFQEVNWYRLKSAEDKSFYSLRVLLGLVLPLLAIVSMIVAYRLKKNLGILIFVLQVMLIGDLVYLVM